MDDRIFYQLLPEPTGHLLYQEVQDTGNSCLTISATSVPTKSFGGKEDENTGYKCEPERL